MGKGLGQGGTRVVRESVPMRTDRMQIQWEHCPPSYQKTQNCTVAIPYAGGYSETLPGVKMLLL